VIAWVLICLSCLAIVAWQSKVLLDQSNAQRDFCQELTQKQADNFLLTLNQLREMSASALEAVKAKDLQQLVAAQTNVKNVDAGIQYLKNQYDVEQYQEAQKKPAEPKFARGIDAFGDPVEIDLNEYEIFG